MKTMQGPAIFLAQFMGDHAPFDSAREIREQVMARLQRTQQRTA